MSLIQLNINNPTDARNALSALSILAGGGNIVISGNEGKASFPSMGESEPEKETAYSEASSQSSDSDSLATKEQQQQQAGGTIDLPDLGKKKFSKTERDQIVAACEKYGVAVNSKTSTPNLAKRLKKAMAEGATQSAVTISTDTKSKPPAKSASKDKVKVELVRQKFKEVGLAYGPDPAMNLMEVFTGVRGISNLEENQYPLVVSMCDAALNFKKLVDDKGEDVALDILSKIGGPECAKLSELGSDKLNALTGACLEVLNA